MTGLVLASAPNLNLPPPSPSHLPVPTPWPSPLRRFHLLLFFLQPPTPRLHLSVPTLFPLRLFPPSSFLGSFRRHVLCTPSPPLAPSASRGRPSPRRPPCRLAAFRPKLRPPSSPRTPSPSTKHHPRPPGHASQRQDGQTPPPRDPCQLRRPLSSRHRRRRPPRPP